MQSCASSCVPVCDACGASGETYLLHQLLMMKAAPLVLVGMVILDGAQFCRVMSLTDRMQSDLLQTQLTTQSHSLPQRSPRILDICRTEGTTALC